MWQEILWTVPLLIFAVALIIRRRQPKPRAPQVFRRVLISGCDSGIGLELALQLHSLGLTILAGCLSTESEGARKLKTLGRPGISVLQLDVTDDASIKRALAASNVYEFGLWGLVNNAGVCVMGEFEWLTSEQIERQVQVNFLGALRLTRECLPFIRRYKGRIVFVSSVQATQPFPGLAVYSASKAALESYAEALRLEVSRHGVHVAVVQPGDLVKHTALLERQKTEYDVMWDNMSPRQRREFEASFKKYRDTVLKNMGYFSPASLKNARVFRDVRHALNSEHPRSRYDAMDAWAIFLRILAMSPAVVSRTFLGLLHNASLKA